MERTDLNVAEIPYESGAIRYRYSRVLSEDRNRWIRHGLFVEYAESGQVIAEGHYVNGKEQGLWRTFYPSGQCASEGHYSSGLEEGEWHFWSAAGVDEAPVLYRNGQEVGSS